GDEGAPPAWIVFEPAVAEAMRELRPGTEVLVLTWLDRADRDVLVCRPRDDPANPLTGVFSTRSSDRPNPIGLHRVRIAEVAGLPTWPVPWRSSAATVSGSATTSSPVPAASRSSPRTRPATPWNCSSRSCPKPSSDSAAAGGWSHGRRWGPGADLPPRGHPDP